MDAAAFQENNCLFLTLDLRLQDQESQSSTKPLKINADLALYRARVCNYEARKCVSFFALLPRPAPTTKCAQRIESRTELPKLSDAHLRRASQDH